MARRSPETAEEARPVIGPRELRVSHSCEGRAVKVFAWYVDNPFGRCASARVAAFGANRRDAVRKVKAYGLKVDHRTTSRFAGLDDEDLGVLRSDPAAVWIRNAEPGHQWITATELRDGKIGRASCR